LFSFSNSISKLKSVEIKLKSKYRGQLQRIYLHTHTQTIYIQKLFNVGQILKVEYNYYVLFVSFGLKEKKKISRKEQYIAIDV
jgi:hypothetical protein